MRVLHISHRYWPAVSGAEAYLGEYSRFLATRGYHVTVATTDALDFELLFTPGRQRVPLREEWQQGVRIVRFPVQHLPFSPLAYAGWRRLLWLLSTARVVPTVMLSSIAHFTPWVPELGRWLRSTGERFDLVAGFNICFESLVQDGQRFACRRQVPFVVHPLTHLGAGARPGTDSVGRFYTMRHQQKLVQAGDAVIAQTPTERAYYRDRGVSEQRIHVIGPGVNPATTLGGNGQRFRQRHNIQGPLVVALSTMTYDKGTVHVVEAVRRLWHSGARVDLALAGAILTSFRRYLDGLVAKDRDRVRVLGAIDEQEKRDLLAAADIVAVPSRTDSFGIVYLEAWLYRKPVIGAQAWGINDVIDDGQDGLLVPFGDVRSLANAIAYLLEHPSQREAMGARGERKVYRSHTWAYKCSLLQGLYERLAGKSRIQ